MNQEMATKLNAMTGKAAAIIKWMLSDKDNKYIEHEAREWVRQYEKLDWEEDQP